MNAEAILALIGELYAINAQLSAEVAALKKQMAEEES